MYTQTESTVALHQWHPSKEEFNLLKCDRKLAIARLTSCYALLGPMIVVFMFNQIYNQHTLASIHLIGIIFNNNVLVISRAHVI